MNPGQIGDITFTAGSLTFSKARIVSCNIKESLEYPFGAIGNVIVVDPDNSIEKFKGFGDEPCSCKWTDHNGKTYNFNFVVNYVNNISSVKDSKIDNTTSIKHDTYDFELGGVYTKNSHNSFTFGYKDKPPTYALDILYKRLGAGMEVRVTPDPTSQNINTKNFSEAHQLLLAKCAKKNEKSPFRSYVDRDSGKIIFTTFSRMFRNFSGVTYQKNVNSSGDPNDSYIIDIPEASTQMSPLNKRQRKSVSTSTYNPYNGNLTFGENVEGILKNAFYNLRDALNNKQSQDSMLEKQPNNSDYTNGNFNAFRIKCFSKGVDIGKTTNVDVPANESSTGNPNFGRNCLVYAIVHQLEPNIDISYTQEIHGIRKEETA